MNESRSAIVYMTIAVITGLAKSKNMLETLIDLSKCAGLKITVTKTNKFFCVCSTSAATCLNLGEETKKPTKTNRKGPESTDPKS